MADVFPCISRREEEKYLLDFRMVGREDLLGGGNSWQPHEMISRSNLTGGRCGHMHSALQGWGCEASRESRGSGDGQLLQLSRLTLWDDKKCSKELLSPGIA